MKKIIAVVALSAATTAAFAISPSLLAQQQAAMTYGVNSNVRVVGNTIYVPTTTRFDNKAPTYSPAYQNTVSNALSQGYSMTKGLCVCVARFRVCGSLCCGYSSCASAL